jgi:hypothetical protein
VGACERQRLLTEDPSVLEVAPKRRNRGEVRGGHHQGALVVALPMERDRLLEERRRLVEVTLLDREACELGERSRGSPEVADCPVEHERLLVETARDLVVALTVDQHRGGAHGLGPDRARRSRTGFERFLELPPTLGDEPANPPEVLQCRRQP